MKVALVSLDFLEYTVEYSNALSKQVDLLLILPKSTPAEALELVDKSIKLVIVDLPRIRNPRNLLLMSQISKKIKSFKPDLLHVVASHPWYLFLLYPLRHIPLVNSIHDVKLHPGEEKLRTKIAQQIMRWFTDYHIVHASVQKRILIEDWKMPENKIQVVPFTSWNIFLNWGNKSVTEEKDTILFFGRVQRYKGLQYLFQAEPLVAEKVPGVRFIVAGGGDLRPYMRYLNSGERFTFINEYLTNPQVSDLFRRASLVVLPYTEASQSGVLQIAYAFKKPVVTTNVGSMPEYVVDGTCGRIIEPANSETLAGAIVDVISNDDRRRRMGEQAYDFMERQYPMTKVVKETLEVYRKAITPTK
jgi:alpha-maltose-1-phosphate synthase